MRSSRRPLRCRSLPVLGVALASLFLTPLRSDATPILDQSQVLTSTLIIAINTGPLGAVAGQSFTVGITGTLTEVDLYLSDVPDTIEPALYTTTGAPPTLLQSSSMPAFTVPGFYSFAFSQPVTIGDTLFFGFALDADEEVTFRGTLTNPYAGGALGGFEDGGAIGYVGSADLAFRTFVDPEVQPAVPEPATLSLLGLGLAGTAVRRWRQRKAS